MVRRVIQAICTVSHIGGDELHDGLRLDPVRKPIVEDHCAALATTTRVGVAMPVAVRNRPSPANS